MLTYPPVKKVSVVIPVYNEQDSLPELLRRTDAACATLGRQYEILLIDDGSSDDSARMLTEAAEAEGSHVVAVLLNRNYGQHSAIMAGFSHVTGDLIITLDADLQNPPEIRGWWRRLMKVTTWWAPSARTVRTASSVKPRRR